MALIHSLLTAPSYTKYLVPLLLLGEIFLCALIVRFIPFTEIDYATYLEQARVFQSGERHYNKITGPSGPCVYPALHLYIYSAIENLLGDDLKAAQMLFACVYLVTLGIIMQCYRRVGRTWMAVDTAGWEQETTFNILVKNVQ